MDEGLNPNERHEYRVVFWLGDGTWRAAETTVATLAHAPRIYGPMGVTGESFKLAIVSDLNPPETEYRITLSDRVGVVTSEESASKCRTFDGLLPGASYRFEAVAVNLDGVETSPLDQLQSRGRLITEILTQGPEAPNDAWTVDKLNTVSMLYGLTERAQTWMLSDLRVDVLRDMPIHSGRDGRRIEIGRVVEPTTVMGEVMHVFWEYWDSFPEECGEMNPFTFRQDIARFMLEFKEADDLGRESVWEDWRPFYRFLRDIMIEGYSGEDDPWELLAQNEFVELHWPTFDYTETHLLAIAAGKLSLIPPPLQPYFKNFLADTEETTWRDELLWRLNLSLEDRYLWDTAFFTIWVQWDSEEYYDIPLSEQTAVPVSARQRLRNADRQLLVDFVNTLEDISCSSSCEEHWGSNPGLWRRYFVEHLFRAQFYLEEMSPEIGIELDQANLDAIRDVLRPIISDLYCGPLRAYALRGVVTRAEGVSELQRAALRQMLAVHGQAVLESGDPNHRPIRCVDWRP